MKFLSRERLSQHKYKTPEGYLICVDSVLARTGKQTYRRDEVFHDSDDTEIEVDRKPEEVFSEQTLASFENKPITVEHPDCDVTCENYKDYAVGFVRDVKRGTVDGQDVILGTLVIQDAKTIDEIEAGEHVELSCGYDCDIKDEENPQQRNIRGNHVALCEQGRAGNARIVDTADDMYGLVKEPTTRYFLAKFFNEKWETDDNVAVIKAKNETEAENKLKRSGIKYDSIRELTHSEYIKFARLTTVIDSLKTFYTQRRGVIYVYVNYALVGKFSSKKDARDAGYDLDGAIKFNANYIVKDMEDSMKTRDELTVNQFKSKIDNSSMDKNKLEAIRKEVMASRLMNIDKQWLIAYINSLISDLERMEDSIDDEISEAYKKWFKLLGDHSTDKNALQKDIVLIMKDRKLTYVEADELIKRAKRFIPQQDSVDDASEEYDMILRKINKAKGDVSLLEDVRRDVKASALLTEDEKNRLLVVIRSALSEVNDSTPYEEVTKNLNKNVDDAEVKIVPGMKLKNGNEILVVESNDGESSIVKTSTGKRYRYSTYDLAENLKMSPTWSVIKDSLKKFTVEDAEKTYKIYVKNAFGAYKVADWPAESKEKAVEEFLELNPRYKKIGIVEARDSVSNSSERTDNSLKTFKVQYTKDSETHIHLVKAKTVQDALKKVNDYRDLNDMTNAIIQCNKDMESAKDKDVEYLACKSLLEDIVNQADPKVKEHWRQEKDNWLKAMKAKYNV